MQSDEKKKGRVIEQKTAEGTVVDKQSTVKVIVEKAVRRNLRRRPKNLIRLI